MLVTACTFSPVRPTGNSTTRSSTRSSVSSGGRRCAVPEPAIRPPPRSGGVTDPPCATGRPVAVTPAATLAAERGLPGLGADRDRSSGTRGREMSASPSGGLFLDAPRLRVRAPRRELAALRRVHEVGRTADDRVEPGVARLRQLRDRLEQRLGVRVARRARTASASARTRRCDPRTSPRCRRRGRRRRRGRG